MTPTPMAELTLEVVKRATSGDSAALDEILTSISRPFFNLALRMLQNHEDAEDATQEALVRVATKLSAFRGESRFSTWAWTVASRSMLDFRAGQAKHAALTAEEFAADLAQGMTPAPQSDPETRILVAQVKLGCGRAMLQVLDGDHRLTYTLVDILGLDQAEAAAALRISHAALRKRLSRARARLRAVLQNQCGVVSELNECRCSRRIAPATALGRLGPKDAVDLDVDAISAQIRALDKLSQLAAYFQADPMSNASERLLPQVRKLLRVA